MSMSSPNLWKLPLTKNEIEMKVGDLQNLKHRKQLVNFLRGNPYNEVVSLIIPDTNITPMALQEIVQNSIYYLVKKMTFTNMIRHEFIEAFVKRGKVTALNCANHFEVDDIYAITPDGVFILLVNKDLYQSLGIQGRLHKPSIKKKDRYVIKIDLKSPHLKYGTKFYQRIKFGLSILDNYYENKDDECADFRFIWNLPKSSDICESSIGKYFHDLGHVVELCQPQLNIHQEHNLKFPKFVPEIKTSKDIPFKLIEYFGMSLLSCDFDEPDELLSSFKTSAETEPEQTSTIIHWKTFHTTESILYLIEIIEDYLKNNPNKSWVGLNVCGYRAAPVNFYKQDHNYTNNGDNDFLLVFYPNKKFFLYTNRVSNKVRK